MSSETVDRILLPCNYSCIVIIPDVLVTNLITKICKPCLVVMACQTMLDGMKVFITGEQNSHVKRHYISFGGLCVLEKVSIDVTTK